MENEKELTIAERVLRGETHDPVTGEPYKQVSKDVCDLEVTFVFADGSKATQFELMDAVHRRLMKEAEAYQAWKRYRRLTGWSW